MNLIQYIMGGAIIVISTILVILILFQKERASTGMNAFDSRSDSFYGKNMGKTKHAVMQKVTIYLTIALAVLAIATNIVVLLSQGSAK